MKVLNYMKPFMNDIVFLVQNNSPMGYNATNIRVEHYSCNDDNRVIIDNTLFLLGEEFPFSASIGKTLETNIVFHGVRDFKRQQMIRKHEIRKNLANLYNGWLDSDEEFLEILTNILIRA